MGRGSEKLAESAGGEESFSGLQIKTPLQFGHGDCKARGLRETGWLGDEQADRPTHRPTDHRRKPSAFNHVPRLTTFRLCDP